MDGNIFLASSGGRAFSMTASVSARNIGHGRYLFQTKFAPSAQRSTFAFSTGTADVNPDVSRDSILHKTAEMISAMSSGTFHPD